MKKITATLIAVVILVFSTHTSLGFAKGRYVIGENMTTANLNIRSKPWIGGKRIGHFLKGATVQVEAIIGDWCRVQYKKYRRAYVYCPYLKSADKASAVSQQTSSSTQENLHGSAAVPQNIEKAPAARSLSPQGQLTEVQRWLDNNDEGNLYISDSYWKANQKAQAWSPKAQLSNFTLEYSGKTGASCNMLFASEDKSRVVLKAWCLNASDKIDTAELKKTGTYETFDLPALLLQQFVAAIMNDKTLLKELNDYFVGSDSVRLVFTLGKTPSGPARWSAKFSDGTKFFIISAAADRTVPELATSKG